MGHLSHLFIEAATLLVAGMVFVYAFLGLLVVFIKTVLTPLAKRYPDPQPKTKKSTKTIQTKQGIEPGIVAAISAAVNQHRNNADKK